MATKNKTLKAEFNSFGGIDIPSCHRGQPCLMDISNFRVTEDGSLEKRSGYKHRYTHPSSPIKTVWSGNVGGIFKCYVLFGSQLCEFNFETNTPTLVGTIPESDDVPSMFHHKDHLLLNCSTGLYRLDPSPTKITGYIPLYGKDWGTMHPGEIHEPLNCLNRYARISYLIPPSGYLSMLPTKHKATSVLSVYKNGELLPSSAYYLDSDYDTVNIRDGVSAGDKFLVTLEFADHITDEYLSFMSTNKAVPVGEMTKTRIFAWGGKDKNKLFVSSPRSYEEISASETVFPGSGDLYFSEGNILTVGDGKNDISAITQHYDRILIFTNGDVWMANSDMPDGNIPTMSINSAAGCASSECVVRAGNDPISIGQYSILRWTSDTDERNECNAESISDRIAESLSPSFFKNGIAFRDAYRDEIWFSDSQSPGTVWIYGIKKDIWFKFSNIHAQGFFDADGKIGFYNGNSLFVFEEDLDNDITSSSGDEAPILATMFSGLLDFGTYGQKKLTELEFKGDLAYSSIDVYLMCNGKEINTLNISDVDHLVVKRRVHTGRSSFFVLGIYTNGKAKQRIHSISIKAKEKL